MDDAHKSGLYRWQRQNKPKVQSRSHKVTTQNDIQDWIKKVTEASDKATDVAFGLAPSGKERGKAAVRLTAGHVRDHEHACSEAQELLTQWVNEKLHFDDDDGFDDLEAWRRKRELRNANNNQSLTSAPTRDSGEFNWDAVHELAADDSVDIDEAAIYERVKKAAIGEEDPYAHLYEMEEEDAVSSVMKNMMRKEVVKETFKRDLGFDDPLTNKPDPRTKMELRHKMVKENREKRQKEEERKKLTTQMKKEARLKAQQLVLKEQKDRDSKMKKEEMETKKEMAKIRKDLQAELRSKEEALKREADEKELMNKMAREELERQKEAEEKAALEVFRQESSKKKQHMVKVELFKAKQAARSLKILHQHFTAWYDIILAKRLLLGKVKAMSDWKLMVRVWGAWRSHVRGRQVDLETEVHERNVIDTQRKGLVADRHFTLSLLRRCFLTWQLFVQEENERKEMREEQEKTRGKMMSLLSAVVEGKLGGAEEGGGGGTERGDGRRGIKNRRVADGGRTTSARSVPGNVGQSTDSQKVMFQQQAPRQAWGETDSIQSSHSNVSCDQQAPISGVRPGTATPTGKGRSAVPTEAWQVTRQHLKLTAEEIAHLGEGGEGGEEGERRQHTNQEIRRRFGTQPWMKQHYVVDSFQHRYSAQQLALKEQQQQIREQQRLIQELQYEQRQQSFRQHLAGGHAADGSPGGVGAVPPLPPEIPAPEAPPPGRQIPRGDEANEPHAGQCASQPEIWAEQMPAASSRLGDGSFSYRSNVLTERSETSVATNMTSTTTGSKKMPHSNKYLQVLKNMEDRAADRARLKAEREEKRRRQEEEKLAKLQAEESKRLQEIEDEKKAKAEAYKQKKRLEKQREEEKRLQQEKEKENLEKAAAHQLRSVMKYRGLLPFKKLISLAKRNWVKAIKHRDREILRQCLQGWRQFTEDEVNRKKEMADEMNHFLMVKHSFQKWRKYKYHQEFLERRAARYHSEQLRARCFNAWLDWVAVEREESRRCMEVARQHYLRYSLRKAFRGWRYLPEQMKREEERQKRKLELRMKVAELIPDFAPSQSVKVEKSEDLS
ncbi:coiled-coil domain-containing protein 191 isoform X1 [Aplysia californica]|uniref:Coiled-coil domain-containing protein 191 isoform X1 n=2 Tax=Aplysia californica TaxID=6500 RepID=A0ABM1VQZ1_APLCA|nr:coiled-coil domain-containing protein 191 isoform X1 [Aplysia californica]